MEICRVCWSCSSICSCDTPELEEAGYCENCGSITQLEELNGDGFCSESECVEAYEEWRDEKVLVILEQIENFGTEV